MRHLKKVIAIVLCVATIIGTLSIICSAKSSTPKEGWVELVYDGPASELNFNVPYNVISESDIFATHVMVKAEGKAIEDCFTVIPTAYDGTDAPPLDYIMGVEYLGFCIYDKKDNCYYAQLKVHDPEFKKICEQFGFKTMLKCIIVYPTLYIAKLLDFKINAKCYQYAHGTLD